MPGIFKSIGRGLLSGLDRAAGAGTGGLLDPRDPTLARGQRAGLRGAFISDLGSTLTRLGGGPAGDPRTPGVMEAILFQRQQQQEAQEKLAAEQAQAAELERRKQLIANGGPRALARDFAVSGDSANVNALANFEKTFNPTAKPAALLKSGDFHIQQDPNTGELVKGTVTSAGFQAIPGLEVTWEDVNKFDGRGNVVNRITGESTPLPEQPKLMNINGSPGLFGKDGATDINGKKIEDVKSLSPLSSAVEGRVFDSYLAKHDGDLQKASKEYLEATRDEGDDGVLSPGTIATAEKIVAGDIPVRMIYGLPRKDRTGIIEAIALIEGSNITALGLDQLGQASFERGRNARPAQRLREAIVFADETSKKVLEANKELGRVMGDVRTRFPVLNSVAIESIIQGGTPEQQKAALAFKSFTIDLIPEVATVFRGGGQPTEESMKLAAEMVKIAWSEGNVEHVINTVLRVNLALRLKAIKENRALTFTGNPVAGEQPINSDLDEQLRKFQVGGF